MPLKVVTRKDTGTLWITGTIRPSGSEEGIRIRQRAGTDDEALAREEAASIEREILRNHHLGKRPVQRSFAAAVLSYSTAETRARQTDAIATRLLRYFGDVSLDTINQEALDKARAVLLQPDAAPATVRRNLIGPLRAILMHASRRGWCGAPRFDLPREPEGRTAFLLPDQVEVLLDGAGHIRPLLTYLICTGCRLGEALALEWSQVDLRGARVNVWPDQTKAGKRRVVTLPPAAVAALGGLAHRAGRVFLRADGEPYRATGDGGGHIARPWAAACNAAGLPGRTVMAKAGGGVYPRFVPDVGVHVLRHSWASYYYAITHDLLSLKDAGGWSSITLVERYAHLLPSDYEEEITKLWGLPKQSGSQSRPPLSTRHLIGAKSAGGRGL